MTTRRAFLKGVVATTAMVALGMPELSEPQVKMNEYLVFLIPRGDGTFDVHYSPTHGGWHKPEPTGWALPKRKVDGK